MSVVAAFTVPSEVVENFLSYSDPYAVSSFAQTCRAYRSSVYGSEDQTFWRGVYLGLPLDDPRYCVDNLGQPQPISCFDWRSEVKTYVRACAVTQSPEKARPGELVTIIKSIIRLASYTPPLDLGTSRNLMWIFKYLAEGELIYSLYKNDKPLDEIGHLTSKLHVMVGVTQRDVDIVGSRAIVYNLDNYIRATKWGPFKDRGKHTNWKVLQAVQYLVVHQVIQGAEDVKGVEDWPPSAPKLQGPKVYPASEGDWASISGLWKSAKFTSAYCWCTD
jgi:hypothetical protein